MKIVNRFNSIYISFNPQYLLLICVCCSLITTKIKAQDFNHHSLQLFSDNDSYTFTSNDGYYTNGLSFVFSWSSARDTSNKTIHSLEMGQLMYNAKNGSYLRRDELDRPVTAFLYGQYDQTRFNKKNSVLRWGITVGTIGPPAFGRELQQTIHHIFHMYSPNEWDYQLKTEIGVNGSVTWSPALPKLFGAPSHFKLMPIGGAELGNTFTNANIGAALLIGTFNKNNATVFWNSQLNSQKRESFFYMYPQLKLSAYNATVQGGLLRKDKGPYTGKLNHVLYIQRAGWMYAKNAFSMGVSLVYTSRESLTQYFNQWYGSLQFGIEF